MREEKEILLKQELRFLAIETRARLNLTQRRMSDLLDMSETSYSDIETGVYMCGTLTAVLLLMEHEDPKAYLSKLKEKFKTKHIMLLF